MLSKIKKLLALGLTSAMILTIMPVSLVSAAETRTENETEDSAQEVENETEEAVSEDFSEAEGVSIDEASATTVQINGCFWWDDEVQVAVYASDGTDTSLATNSDVLKLLNIKYVQDDDFAPIGVISLSESFFRNKDQNALIQSDEDWNEVYSAISSIDTSKLSNQGINNVNNWVYKNLDKVSVDIGYGMGSQYTALFAWNEKEHVDKNYKKSAISGRYDYHLDLRFETRTITFKGLYTDKTGTHTVDMGSRVFLNNTASIEPKSAGDWYLDTSVIPDGYVLDGYYSDSELSDGYTFGNNITEDTTVYVKLTKSNLSVSYDLNGGTSSTTKLTYDGIKLGSERPSIKAPEKTGYTLSGWEEYDSEGNLLNTYDADELPNYVTGTVTYKAVWSAAKVTYTIVVEKQNTDGKTYTKDTPYTVEASTGETVVYNEDAPDGFELDGDSVTEATVAADGSTELHIIYNRKSFTVSYKYLNETLPKHCSSLPASKTYMYGETVSIESDATATGYKFSGWSRKTSFTMPADNVEITGSFTASGKTAYVVEHYTENLEGDGYTLFKTENLTGNADTIVYGNAITIDGFTYSESKSKDSSSGTIDVDNTLVLKLYYTRDTYKITYSFTGDIPAAASLPDGLKTSYKYGETVKAQVATLAGYTFSGWSRDNFTISATDKKEILITGSFTANNNTAYKVEVYLENIDDTDFTLSEEKSESRTGTTGELVTISESKIPAITGFEFDSDNSDNLLSGTIAGDESLTLKLYYTRNRYEVSYSLYEGSSASDTEIPTGGSYKYGQTVNVEPADDVDGYSFSGWTVNYEVGKASSNTSFTMPACNVTINGRYSPTDGTGYTVNYYLEKLSTDGKVEYELKKSDSLTGVTDSEVKADEKSFEGFSIDKDIDGTLASGTIKNDGSLVLSLYYKRNTYKVTYVYDTLNSDYSAEKLPEEKEYKYGQTVQVASYLEADGYTFSGWDKSGTFTISADTTITGYFTANETTVYKVNYYLESLEDENDYKLDSTKEYYGKTGTAVDATILDFTGFTYDEDESADTISGTIAGDGSLELNVYYSRNSYDVYYTISGVKPDGIDSKLPETKSYKYGQIVEIADDLEAAGYIFNGWSIDDDFTMKDKPVEITGTFNLSGDTKYTVKHYLMNLDGTAYSEYEADIETFQGETLSLATATAHSYTGFTVNEGMSTFSDTIAADGSMELSIYYDRNQYQVYYSYKGTVPEQAGEIPASESYYFGQEISLADTPETPVGYNFSGWEIDEKYKVDDTYVMGDGNITVSGSFTPKNDTKYVVEYYKENLDGTYTLAESVECEGTTGELVNAEIKNNYSHYEHNNNSNDVLSGKVAGDGSLVLKVYYDREMYLVSYAYIGNVPEGASVLPVAQIYKYGTTLTIEPVIVVDGYEFSGWGNSSETYIVDRDISFYGSYRANGDTAYTLNHYLEQLDGTYILDNTETLTAETDTEVYAAPKQYTGFTYDGKTESETVAGNGSTVLNLYYNRNVHTVTVQYKNTLGNVLAASAQLSVKYGDSFIIYTPNVSGYTPRVKAIVSPENGMPDYNITVTVYYDSNKKNDDGDDNDDTDDSDATPSVVPTSTRPDDGEDDGATPITPGTVTDVDEPIDEAQILDESIPTGQITLSEDGDTSIVTIDDADTALFGEKASGWALLNLIAMLVGAVYAIYLALLMLRRNKKQNDEEETMDEAEEEEKKDKKMFKLLSILAGILSVIVFILTENIENPMVIVDSWTVFMIILLVVEILLAYFSRKKKAEDKEEKQQ